MREILFRGKELNTGTWIEGFYVYHINRTPSPIGDSLRLDDEEHLIAKDAFSDWNMPRGINCYHVDPKTVSQYTGLKDRHGKRIFEDDIVEFDSACGSFSRHLIWWVREMSMLTAIPVDGISFNGQDYWNGNYPQFEYSSFCLMTHDPWGDFRDVRVIGNIHDNPELIGGAEIV